MKNTLISISIIYTFGLSWAQNIIPAQEPLIKLSRPKNNIFALFDDSASIASMDIYVSEHFYGFGQPTCIKPDNWHQIINEPQYQQGKYYNAFAQGSYIPYNPNSQHFGYDGSIYIKECAKLNRSEAFRIVLKQFLTQFHKEYFIGFGGLGENNTASLSWYENYQKNYPLILSEIDDLSQQSPAQWNDLFNKIDSLFLPTAVLESWSPIFPAIYNISLYFRNYPLPQYSDGAAQGYTYQQFTSPLRYRCARNNILLFTDGRPNRSYIDVFAKKDVHSNATIKFASNLQEAQTKEYNENAMLVTKARYPSLLAQNLMDTNYYDYATSLGYVKDGYTGSEDGIDYNENFSYLDPNRYTKATYKITDTVFQHLLKQNLLDGYSGNAPLIDTTGKFWADQHGVEQTLNINSIVFSNNPTKEFTDLLTATNGRHITQDHIDLSTTFENILNLFEQSNALNSYTNGFSIEDQYMRTRDTIRYVFHHNYYTNSGSIRAYSLKDNKEWHDTPIWTTDQKTHPFDGKFVTMSYDSSTQKSPNDLTTSAISTAFRSTYSSNLLDIDHLDWLRGITHMDHSLILRPRISPIGPIVNAKPSFLAKDREYINLNFVSDEMKKSFEDYIKFKAKNMNTELIITGANDGLIHFIQTNRKNELSKNQGGMRKAAYFPGFLASRLLDITKYSRPFTYTMDGQSNIFEFIGKNGDFLSIGVTGMGAGGKGLVGYQLFKMSANKKAEQDIKPLFEIVNEDNFAFNTPAFQNLGYTYSGFEFFNQGIANKKNAGTGIAVFGNGLGNKTSSLYFIDVETGKLLREIILNTNGGGAATPALSLIKNKVSGLQQLNYLVVGDQSGKLYQVNFSGDDIANANYTIKTLYQPAVLFKHPISTRPMLYTPESDGPIWVYFGTGRKVDEQLDRGKNSKEHQYFIAFPMTIKPNLSSLYQVQYSVQNNIVKLENEDSNEKENLAKSGWYLQFTPSARTVNGNRLVYQPGVTAYGDIVFSTWELEEGSDTDLCIEDVGAGLQFALDANTATKGLFKSNNRSVSGVSIVGTAPGIPSGTTITYLGYLTGAMDQGAISTLSIQTIEELNKLYKSTSHAEETQYLQRCLATTNGETNIQMPEFCHDIEKRILLKKRLSIQTLY